MYDACRVLQGGPGPPDSRRRAERRMETDDGWNRERDPFQLTQRRPPPQWRTKLSEDYSTLGHTHKTTIL